jgi:hypothetical protein
MTKFIIVIVVNLAKPKAAAKHELLYKRPAFGVNRSELVEPKSDLSSTTKYDQFMIVIVVNLVTLKAAAKHELLIFKPASKVG